MRHRDFLQNKARFKTIVKIESAQVLSQIHLVYKLNYLKDTAIARFIDDSVLQNINSLVYMNSTDIVNYIFQNKAILQDLLGKMRGDHKHEAVEFLMEVCQMSKNIQMGARFSFIESMGNLVEVLTECLNLFAPDIASLKLEAFQDQAGLTEHFTQTYPSEQAAIEDFISVHDKFDIRKLDLLKINAIEILMSITQQTQFGTANASLRHFVLCEDQKAKGYPFIKRLTSHMLFAYEQGIKVQVFEFFKQLLDNEQTDKKVEFNDLFYKECLTQFLSFLTSAENISPEVSSSAELPVQNAVDSRAAHIEAYNKSLDYSRFLVVQLLTKCA